MLLKKRIADNRISEHCTLYRHCTVEGWVDDMRFVRVAVRKRQISRELKIHKESRIIWCYINVKIRC